MSRTMKHHPHPSPTTSALPSPAGRERERRSRGRVRVSLALTLVATSACSLAPKYVRPDLPVPPSWPVGDAYLRQQEAALPAITYASVFTDPRLRTIIERALANNRDLRVAAATDDTSINDSPSIQISAPSPDRSVRVVSGGYMNHPPSGAALKKIDPPTNTPPSRNDQ